MAEFGAHLATTSSELPSIFEVLAQENLSSTLGPAFGHLAKVVAQVDPGRFEKLWKWHQEIFSSLELLLQHYCLKSCGASFAENFYGLKRSPLGDESQLITKPDYVLPISHHRKALACLVLVPYIRLKLNNLYENLSSEGQDSADATNKWPRIKSVFLKIYPLLYLSLEMTMLIYQVNYALGRTTFSSPLYQLAKTQLITLSDEDDAEQPFFQLWNDVRNSSLTSIPWTIISHVRLHTRELFTSALSIGTFFLQYIEWWYSNKDNADALHVSVIPFPVKDSAQIQVPKGRVCPICLQNRTNDTVLSVSGYAFCYPCIYSYVNQHGICPITKLPTSEDQMVRLFSTN